MKNRRFGGVGVLLVSALAVGCGGAGKGKPTTPATDEAGRAVKTAGGAELSVEAHNHWKSGLDTFARFEKEGWNESKCKDAASAFERAVSAQSEGRFAEALYMAGLSHARCGSKSDAQKYYERALEQNPKLCKARVAMGVMQLEQGNEPGAFSIFQQAVKDDARCTEGYVNLAVLQRQKGGKQIDEARVNLRRALAIDSSYLPAFNELALLFYEQAVTTGKGASLDLAEVVSRQAQLLDRNYAAIYNTWGLIKMRKGDIIEALRYFERARSLDDSMFEAHMNFGQVTLSFRGYQDAKAAFERATALKPQSYEARVGLGAAFRGLREFDKAQEQYAKAIELDANRPEAYFNLGVLHQDYMSGTTADLAKAKSYFEQFMSRAGSRPQYADNIQDVKRTCQVQQAPRGSKKKLQRSSDCRPGRIQNITTAIDALREAEAMQREAAAQQQ